MRIDDLRIKMILPNVGAVLCLNAFACHSGANNFGQAISIDGIDIERILYFSSHRVSPRLRSAKRDLERSSAGVEPLGAKFVQDHEKIRWCWDDHVRSEV